MSLRPWAASDAGWLPEHHDPATAHWLGEAVPTRSTYAAWLAEGTAPDGTQHTWAIVGPDPDRGLLGGLALTPDGPAGAGSARLTVWLLPDARGRGLAGQAVDSLVARAFTEAGPSGLGLRRLAAVVALDNRPALRLLRRCGFRETGTARSALVVGAGDAAIPVDAVHLDLLADDDRAAQEVEPLTIPVLETARLRLRAFRDDDGPGADDGPDEASRRFLPAGAHPDAAAYPAWLVRHRRREDAGEALTWCLADRGSDAALGYLALFRMEPLPGRFDAEVGYFLYPSARGHGYLAEALGAAVDHAFTPLMAGGLGLTRLHAGTDLANVASQRVLAHVGFRQWGLDRSAWRNVAGELTDGAYVELLATDDRTDRRPGGGVKEVSLEGLHVRLRPYRPDDAQRVVEACSDPRTRRWLGGLPDPYTTAHAQDYIARMHASALAGTSLGLAVADATDDRLLGTLSLMDLAGQTPLLAEIGYWAHPDARGRGVMTEAVGLAVRHAFSPPDAGGLGLHRLVLRAAAGNAASQRVATANGFVTTGRQRSAERLGDGTWDDLVDFDLLADEWDAREE